MTYTGKKTILYLNLSHKYNSNSLVAALQTNKSNAAGNSKRLHTPGLEGVLATKHFENLNIQVNIE